MQVPYQLARTILLLIICALPLEAASDQKKSVSLLAIIVNPAAFADQNVQVTGFASAIDDKVIYLYATLDSSDYAILPNSCILRLDALPEVDRKILAAPNLRVRLTVTGRVIRDDFGPYPPCAFGLKVLAVHSVVDVKRK